MTQIKNILEEKKSGLPEGWKEVKLGDISTFSQGYQISTSYQYKEKKDGYVRFVRIVDYTNDGEVPRYIKNPGDKYFVSENELVMIRYGSQTAGKIVRGIPGVIANNTFKITQDESVYVDYLYWFLRQDTVYKYLNRDQSSSTMPAITFSQLKKLNINLPSFPTQKSIAKILSSFDEKIELLREENETLEKIGQEVFKEWFGGYKVGSELPEGWRVGKIGKEFDITIGRTPPRKESQWFSSKSKDFKWISIKDIGNSGIYISETLEFLTKEAVQKFNIPVIPKNTLILSFKMTVGKLSITTEEMLSNEAIAHFKIKNGSDVFPEFIYSVLQDLNFNSLGSTSSIVTSINIAIIKNIDIIIPDNKTLKNFGNLIKPLFEKIKINSEEIQELGKTRDELLPRLMRGEVLVKI